MFTCNVRCSRGEGVTFTPFLYFLQSIKYTYTVQTKLTKFTQYQWPALVSRRLLMRVWYPSLWTTPSMNHNAFLVSEGDSFAVEIIYLFYETTYLSGSIFFRSENEKNYWRHFFSGRVKKKKFTQGVIQIVRSSGGGGGGSEKANKNEQC